MLVVVWVKFDSISWGYIRKSCHLPRIQQGADGVHFSKSFVAVLRFRCSKGKLLPASAFEGNWSLVLHFAHCFLICDPPPPPPPPPAPTFSGIVVRGACSVKEFYSGYFQKERLFNGFNVNLIFSMNLNFHLGVCLN